MKNEIIIKIFGKLRNQMVCNSKGELKDSVSGKEFLSEFDFWDEITMIALLNGCHDYDSVLKDNDRIAVLNKIFGG